MTFIIKTNNFFNRKSK